MISLASMYRTTRNPLYLDRLAYHADAALAQTDVARGVRDYRGRSSPCWRSTEPSYTNGVPYCFAVHSGMIGFPIAEFASLVHDDPRLSLERAYDGTSFGEKAARYVAVLELTIAAHDEDWTDIAPRSGSYTFPTDATFLPGGLAGSHIPLNQDAAMGRLLLTMWRTTGRAEYRDRVARLAVHLRASLSVGPSGQYLWNYSGGTYDAPGEDISHASLSVGFASLCHEAGIEFTADDLVAFGATFMGPIYIDADTFSDFLGGGSSTNGSAYKPSAAKWLPLSRFRGAIYHAVRDYYERDFPASRVKSGTELLGWAYLAEFEPPPCDFAFHTTDWSPASGYREATAYGANILVSPADTLRPALVSLTIASVKPTTISQWDGRRYVKLATWPSTVGEWVSRHVTYEPLYWYDYHDRGALFQFEDAFASGEGIRLAEATASQAPRILSLPSGYAMVGVNYRYDADDSPEASPSEDVSWSLSSRPIGSRIDPLAGHINWIPNSGGIYHFTLVASSSAGHSEQSFAVQAIDSGIACALGVFPNPSGKATRLSGFFSGPCKYRIELLDIQGRVLRLLAEGTGGPGPIVTSWDGANSAGIAVPSGLYFCRMRTIQLDGAHAFERVVRLVRAR